MSTHGSSSFSFVHYLLTWAILMVLGLVSFGLVYAPLGGWSLTVSMVIAGVKALLVALVFMHLWVHRGAERLAAASALGLIILLTVLMTVDVVTRR